MKRRHFGWLCVLSSVLMACSKPLPDMLGWGTPTLFEQLPSRQTNITFANTLTSTEQLNGFTFTNFYNGGGVAVGDVDNDGFTDVFFTGNQTTCRLYLNKGKTGSAFTFDDITESAGLTTNRWCSGVVMADVNQDGWLDIYVSVAAHPALKQSENLLFINQGVKQGRLTFREMARDYGLADPSFTTQSTFFDYDLDGDLDAFLLNTAPDLQNPAYLRPLVTDGTHPSTGRLYRNEGRGTGGHPVFRDVSQQAGIRFDGLGLGLVVSDFNRDGYPDLYCSNDFSSSDILYLNDQNGHFTNVIKQATAHTALFGMGVDAADLNNDALPDLMQLDMLPKDNARLKTMLVGQDYDRKEMSISPQYGHQMQYMRNALQLNLGNQPDSTVPIFSEVGLMAGVAQTDWSWAALLADFDNDGWRDIYVANGYRKNVTDRDFINFSEDFSGFGTTEYNTKKRLDLLDKVPEIPLAHVAFRNTANGAFTDVSKAWGLDAKSFANGAAYADLDNDGDLDLIVNNVDAEAFVYRNRSREQSPDTHYLTVRLRGDTGNRQGIGAGVTAWAGGQLQYAELNPVRGYLSSMEPLVHLGLGTHKILDSLRIDWPGGRQQTLYRVAADQTLTLDYGQARTPNKPDSLKTGKPFFADVTDMYPVDFQHRESDFVDFKQTAAMHKMLSRSGFAMAVGDVNGDSLDDCFVGGSYRGSGASLFVQQAGGKLIKKPITTGPDREATAALFFDADGDRDQDLYVVYGGNERPATDRNFYQDELYLNSGTGDFIPAPAGTLPDLSGSGSCVVSADIDHDGDLDLFVGGRQIPGRYPMPARSYLLRNDRGRFTDVTRQLCPALLNVGMVCSALWTDYDNDHWPDLLLAGEWMPLMVLRNQSGQQFTHSLIRSFTNSTGWWNSLAQGDFDGDGDLDYLAGNEGLNTLYHASPAEPVEMIAKDFNNDGTVDPLMGYFIDGVCYPAIPRDALNQQVIQFRRKYQRFADYASVTFDELLTADERKDAYRVQATYLQSAYLENRGKGQFVVHPLPSMAQVSPVFGIVPYDVNHDGKLDAILTGNFYPNEVNMGREDASLGLVLLGDGRGHFKPVSPVASGLLIRGDARTSALLRTKNKPPVLLTAVNGQGLRLNQCLR
ncbi:VCBS repeat-containing protein [Spirosoma rhododendri]|uniref:VCBS repeat-containing protein n=1 Tax=Spirosoma rhododendri TaxID=2728024 RepID=A0A7L5DPD3_9BACT|nr:VCBS repeat-containing protein [Spirosoma rhododendri]QJD80344.1 VCBS repeat-containing protein [Spirosoma rhododendri]